MQINTGDAKNSLQIHIELGSTINSRGVEVSESSPVNETITETTRRSLAASMDAYATLRATKYKEFYDFLDISR